MSKRLKRRQEIDVVIEKVAFGGKGIAHVEEMVLFVENTLPGDQVTARITRVKKNYAEAFPLRILQPSSLRGDAPCEHFGHCGGCKWQHVDYAQQLAFKKQHIEESLRHIGGLAESIVKDPLPCATPFAYRNKMEFSFSDNRWLTPDELSNPEIKKSFALGLHVPRFFDRILDIDKCWIQTDEFNQVLAFANQYFRKAGLPVYNQNRRDGILRFLVLRYAQATGSVLVNVVTFEAIIEELKPFAAELTAACPFVSGVVNTVNSKPAQIATGDERHLIWGDPLLRERLGEYEFEISPDAFFQTNSGQAEKLYEIVRSYVEGTPQTIWDLYSGAGSITIFLSRQAKRLIGFEIVENAVRDAERNCEINGVHNCSFVGGDLRFNLEAHMNEPPELIICDPPRSGMHKDVVEQMLRVAPAQIVYVSCNPTTMARDLQLLGDKYELIEVKPVDMFPHTYHIECVASLRRKA